MLLLACQANFAQLEIHPINLATNEVVYDAVTNRIYAAVRSTNGPNGNSIGIVNPQTYTIENTVFMGSDPKTLAISDDGQYIYAGFDGASTVRRFNVATQTAGLQFPLGSDSFSGPFYAYDISVMPGNASSIAVSRYSKNSSGFYGTAIYDNGIVRSINTNTNYPNDDPYVIRFFDASTMYGFNNHSTGYDFTKMTVASDGVTETSSWGGFVNNFAVENFVYNGNNVYFDYGAVADLSFGAPYISGQFSGANGRVAFDPGTNLVCYATYDFSDTVTFKRYSSETFLLVDSIEVPQATGPVYGITSCGTGCYAFSTANDKLIIINDASLKNNDWSVHTAATVYPNPTNGIINIDKADSETNFSFYDLTGKEMPVNRISDGQIDVSHLTSGIYILKILKDDQVISKKIIKQ